MTSRSRLLAIAGTFVALSIPIVLTAFYNRPKSRGVPSLVPLMTLSGKTCEVANIPEDNASNGKTVACGIVPVSFQSNHPALLAATFSREYPGERDRSWFIPLRSTEGRLVGDRCVSLGEGSLGSSPLADRGDSAVVCARAGSCDFAPQPDAESISTLFVTSPIPAAYCTRVAICPLRRDPLQGVMIVVCGPSDLEIRPSWEYATYKILWTTVGEGGVQARTVAERRVRHRFSPTDPVCYVDRAGRGYVAWREALSAYVMQIDSSPAFVGDAMPLGFVESDSGVVSLAFFSQDTIWLSAYDQSAWQEARGWTWGMDGASCDLSCWTSMGRLYAAFLYPDEDHDQRFSCIADIASNGPRWVVKMPTGTCSVCGAQDIRGVSWVFWMDGTRVRASMVGKSE